MFDDNNLVLKVTVCIPAALVKRVITDDGANWKELSIKIVPFRNFVVKNGQKMAVIEVSRNFSHGRF